MSEAHDIPRIGRPIDLSEFDVFEKLDSLLVARHALQGFTEGRYRAMAVFDRHDPDFGGRILGYGRGHTAEEALVRAVFTWSLPRLRAQSPYIRADDYPESTHSHISPDLRDQSQFDHIVRRGDFRLRIENGKYVAGSDHGAGIVGHDPLEVEGIYPLDAIERLVEEYNFYGIQEPIENLPLTLFSEEEDDDGDDNNNDHDKGA